MALSEKQRQVMRFPYSQYDALICDGSVRSGKTSVMALSFFLWAMGSFDGKAFAYCGQSVGAVERNIILPLLKVRYLQDNFSIQYNRGGHVVVARRGNRENRFYLFGGRDERSFALIQGITLAGVMLDEVALMPRSFVEQALARCSVTGAKLWFNCNPEGPQHWFRQEWILKPEEHNVLHLHFTMDDNPSLDDATRSRYQNMYTGVFYQRYIQGLWVMAEGLIYDMVDQTANFYPPEQRPKNLWVVPPRTIAVDYGTANPCVFLDIYDDGETIRVDREYRWDSRKERRQKTDQEYGDDFLAFMGERWCTAIVDPSAASFIAELRSRGVYVLPADNDVLNGIRRTAKLLQRRELLISTSCEGLVDELGTYRWDDKAAAHGEERPVKENDHCLVGDTLVDTVNGPRKIADLVGTTGAVYCTDGSRKTVRPFHHVRMTEQGAEVFQIELENGKTVTATADHPFLTERGWVMLRDLRTDDKIACIGGLDDACGIQRDQNNSVF